MLKGQTGGNRRFSKGRDYTGNHAPLHDADELAAMRRACQLAAATLDYITDFVEPGVSTGKLDQLIEAYMREHGAVPATLGYKGYPASSCISINHVVNHGIPDDQKLLMDGDIVNIDVTVILDGWYGDTSRTYTVGDNVKVLARRLIDATYEAMMAGIAEVAPGKHMGDVGWAIRQICERERFTSVLEFGGHGVGRKFHDAPFVMHWAEQPGEGIELEPGMFFTVEPMINAGKRHTKILADGWTTVTRDRSLSCQFEHTVAVTETGYEILTLSPKGYTKPPYV
jgi:methionyl aminopeptidase